MFIYSLFGIFWFVIKHSVHHATRLKNQRISEDFAAVFCFSLALVKFVVCLSKLCFSLLHWVYVLFCLGV